MVPRPDTQRRRVEADRNQRLDRGVVSSGGDMSTHTERPRAVLLAHDLEEAIFSNPRAAAGSARGEGQVTQRRVELLQQGRQQEWVVWEPWGLSTWSGRTIGSQEGSGTNSDARSTSRG